MWKIINFIGVTGDMPIWRLDYQQIGSQWKFMEIHGNSWEYQAMKQTIKRIPNFDQQIFEKMLGMETQGQKNEDAITSDGKNNVKTTSEIGNVCQIYPNISPDFSPIIAMT